MNTLKTLETLIFINLNQLDPNSKHYVTDLHERRELKRELLDFIDRRDKLIAESKPSLPKHSHQRFLL